MRLSFESSVIISFVTITLIAETARAKSINSTFHRPDGRIVGGTETSIFYFPHQASLINEGKHICGAAIISRYFLVTAAHCVLSLVQPIALKVRVGTTQVGRGGAVHAVRRVKQHEQYNIPTRLNNDIALMELESPLTFTQFVKPIPLVTRWDNIPPNPALFVSGWGSTSSNSDKVSPNLRYTTVSLWSHRACAEAFYGSGILTQTMLCAGTTTGGRDSCQGDSGGPLVTYVAGVRKLYGLISWGISCADAQYPGVYTSVQFYVEWIQKTMLNMLKLK